MLQEFRQFLLYAQLLEPPEHEYGREMGLSPEAQYPTTPAAAAAAAALYAKCDARPYSRFLALQWGMEWESGTWSYALQRGLQRIRIF